LSGNLLQKRFCAPARLFNGLFSEAKHEFNVAHVGFIHYGIVTQSALALG
jgi:hypothetical protein